MTIVRIFYMCTKCIKKISLLFFGEQIHPDDEFHNRSPFFPVLGQAVEVYSSVLLRRVVSEYLLNGLQNG